MYYVLALALFVLLLGIIEQINHNNRLNKLSVRININGTRGKSTVTRLITSILKESGLKVIGKTTGTSARIMYWNQDKEKPIIRGLLGPNIIEQKNVLKEIDKLGPEAFVTECMAVNPDYQIIFQEKMIKATVGVIVNVREDHLDLCGPTLDFIAESFTATIPYNGHLIITDSKYNDYFIEVARKRNTKTIIADDKKIPEDYLEKFGYVIFPENVSIALAVAEALRIDEKVAFKGMLKANPDPGALKIHSFRNDNVSFFVNAFAANDPNSTLFIWNHITSMGYPTKNPLILLNCRPDRVDRTIQFAEDVLPNMEIDVLVVMGESTKPVTEALNKNKIKANLYINLDGLSPDKVYDSIKDHLIGRVSYSVGNIHGGGEEVVELILHNLSDEYQHVNNIKETIGGVVSDIN